MRVCGVDGAPTLGSAIHTELIRQAFADRHLHDLVAARDAAHHERQSSVAAGRA